MCSRGGKASTKNPSIKNGCPFVMYFVRKSAMDIEHGRGKISHTELKRRKQRNGEMCLFDDNEDTYPLSQSYPMMR